MRTYKPRKSTKPRRKAAPRRRAAKKFPKSTGLANNFANVIETYQAAVDIEAGQAYSLAPKLRSFPRASAVGSNFQFYRCSKVEYKFEPYYNTFQDTSGGATVPQLFWVMNRNGTQPTTLSIPWFQEQGVKPHKLIKDYVISYKPNTLVQLNNNVVSPPAQTSVAEAWDKWINTFEVQSGNYVLNDDCEFQGHVMMVDEKISTPTTAVARMTITAHWEFDKPYTTAPQVGDPGVSETIKL